MNENPNQLNNLDPADKYLNGNNVTAEVDRRIKNFEAEQELPLTRSLNTNEAQMLRDLLTNSDITNLDLTAKALISQAKHELTTGVLRNVPDDIARKLSNIQDIE